MEPNKNYANGIGVFILIHKYGAQGGLLALPVLLYLSDDSILLTALLMGRN